MRSLNVVGAGRVGRVLARLWSRAGVFEIRAVLCRRAAGAAEAVAFIGSGAPLTAIEELPSARVWLIAVPDDVLEAAARALARSGVVHAGDVVFHPSGAQASDALAPLRAAGARVAGVHPVKSFAEPEAAAASFVGTWCGAEGDAEALRVLGPAFEAIGARLFPVDLERKVLYHAAGVFGCNYLTALLELALRCYEAAGVPRETAAAVLDPIARETVDNVFRLGTQGALTGPIARGDAGTVARQLGALREWDADAAAAYRALGAVACDLAEDRPGASERSIAAIRSLLFTE
ncbi:MAG: DUF2520 domain-containing protein [Myxococcales bacterium]|nr:DUF2520 domain-containing protein [Myxococcales bacterium]